MLIPASTRRYRHDTEHTILIRKSWAEVVPIQDAATGLFYQFLFTLDPSVRPMFRGDMREQGRKLMKMLGLIFDSLGRLDEQAPWRRIWRASNAR